MAPATSSATPAIKSFRVTGAAATTITRGLDDAIVSTKHPRWLSLDASEDGSRLPLNYALRAVEGAQASTVTPIGKHHIVE